MGFIATTILTIIIFGAIITIHEFGHFLFAKLGGIKVHEFAIGMGPKLFSKQLGDTAYTLRAFPIGGFVSMEGEDASSEDADAFNKKPVFTRFLVLSAGAVFNLILGLIILVAMNSGSKNLASTTIKLFNENATSVKTGLKEGDEILAINGRNVYIANDIIFELLRDKDGFIDFTVKRNHEKTVLKNVQLQKTYKEDGAETIDVDFKVASIPNNFFNTLTYSVKETISIGRMVFLSLIDLVTGHVSINELAGPIGVGNVIGDAAAAGLKSLLNIAAFLTINIGIFNLLPLPALDGGRLFFLAIEAIRRKPLKPEHEGYVHTVGFVLLLALMLFVTFQDIFKLVS